MDQQEETIENMDYANQNNVDADNTNEDLFNADAENTHENLYNDASNNAVIVGDEAFKNRRSAVMREFWRLGPDKFTDGKERALCKHCRTAKFLSHSYYGTTNMRNHIKKCMKGTNTETQSNFCDQKMYRDLVAKAIIKHGYAFSWVEHEGNREVHEFLNNGSKSICRNTAKADCLKIHQSLKVRLKETLRTVPGRISLTSDMWTSCQTEGYLCLTAHYVDVDWKLRSKVLNFCHIDSPHTGKTMYNSVLALLQDWGIDHKIFSLTLDNASSNDRMQDYLKCTLKSRGALLYNGNFFHVRCAAHVLNLIVKDGLKVIDCAVVKIRDCVKYIKSSETRKKSFQSCVELAQIKEVKSLWLDVPTRWNSTFMMLDRAILYREAFVEMIELRRCPFPEEWEQLIQIRDVLEPFNDITELFSGSDYPTSNLYFSNVWKILMFLRELSDGDDELLRSMAIEMKTKFDKYWFKSDEDDYGMLFAFAVILDPRCKLSVLTFCYEALYGKDEAALKIADIQLKLEKFYKEYDKSSPSTINITSTNSSGKGKRKYDYFAAYDDQVGGDCSMMKSNLDVYLDDAKLERTSEIDILQFWKEKEHKYGELSHLARDILSVPLTTVASESTFSIGGRILNKWRSSCLPENIGALITSRSWLYGYGSNSDEEIGCNVDWATTKSKS